MSTDNVHERKAVKERINIHDPNELRLWSNKLGVTKEELLKAIQKMGDSADDINKYFKREK